MNICIFGDSITWGSNDTEKGGWAERLKTHYLKDGKFDVYNLGIPGEKTEDMLLRFGHEIKAREADVLVLAIGINDSQYLDGDVGKPRVPLETFKENVTRLLVQAEAVTGRILVIGLTRVDDERTQPVPWALTKSYSNEMISRYDNVLQDVAKERGVKYLDVSSVVGSYELSDGLHPDAVGHRKLFEYIHPTIDSLCA